MSPLSVSEGFLVFRGHADGFSGYSQLSMALCQEVEKAGIPVRWEAIERANSLVTLDPWVASRILPSPSVGPKLQCSTPLTPISPGDVLLTMWESTRLDSRMVDNLDRARGVIVPCDEVAGWFRDSGVDVPIAVVPLGYDPEVFIPGAPQTSGRVRFGCAGRTSHGGMRKRLDDVVEAFLEAFPDVPGVELHVKCWRDCKVRATADPRIIVNRQSLSIESLADWYRSLDVFVSASRGEGFGLQPLQAMACGVPHLAPIWGGHRAYMTPETGWAVDHHEEPAEGSVYGGLGHWCVPHRESLVELMRAAASDGEARRAKARAAEIRALDFTWDQAGPILVHALREFGLIPRRPRNATTPENGCGPQSTPDRTRITG